MELLEARRLFGHLGFSLACLLGALGAGACSDDNPDPYQPLTEACDACLLDEGDQGCGTEYQSCEDVGDCESVVLCELYQQCYVSPSFSDCSVSHGCESGVPAAELELAQAFEACARSTCRKICSFAE